MDIKAPEELKMFFVFCFFFWNRDIGISDIPLSWHTSIVTIHIGSPLFKPRTCGLSLLGACPAACLFFRWCVLTTPGELRSILLFSSAWGFSTKMRYQANYKNNKEDVWLCQCFSTLDQKCSQLATWLNVERVAIHSRIQSTFSRAHKGSGTLFMAKCPLKNYILTMWNIIIFLDICPHLRLQYWSPHWMCTQHPWRHGIISY